MNKTHPKTNNDWRNRSGGFTIVETLVAIAVLMIAIAGPLVVATKSLTAALYAKDYAIASFLAQEGMELIRNFKDNELNGFTLQNLRNAPCPTFPLSSLACGIDIRTTSIGQCPSNNCSLYINNNAPNHGYVYGGGSPTIFSRGFFVQKTVGTDYEVKVIVKVQWKEGKIDNEVVISNQMVDSKL